MPGKRVILAAVLGLAGGIALVYFGLRHQAEQAYEARRVAESVKVIGWERAITYPMLSADLQEIISEEEFNDSTTEGRHHMYRKLEDLTLDKHPAEWFDGSTDFYKTPPAEGYELDGVWYTVEFRIDIKCVFDQMEVRNFSCHFYERELEQAS
jgi:hypothetical protein